MCDCSNGKTFCEQLSGEYGVGREFDGRTGRARLKRRGASKAGGFWMKR